MKQEIYVSTDIETDGPIPGPNSMLSFASAAFSKDGKLISKFSANLEFLEGAKSDPKTMSEFWDKNPDAWKACRENLQPINHTMKKYVKWVNELPGIPVFVGYPATFDFMFVYWYIINAGLQSPFSFSALDVKTYVCAMLKSEFRQTTKRMMPKRWFSKSKHTHIALDDAIEQGELFVNILKENLNG